MGRTPCCDKANVKKGPWSPEEDAKLKDYIQKHGTGGNWISLPQKAGLKRCGKSCRLRWLNYLRPDIKHGDFSEEEDTIICNLYTTIGSRWSVIAAQLPGRTDNDIKNYWNTKLKKKLTSLHGMVPQFIQPSSTNSSSSSSSPSSYSNNGPLISTLLEPISFSSNLLLNPTTTTTTNNNPNNNATPLFNHQAVSQDQSFMMSTMVGGENNYHVKLGDRRLLVFGGDQGSCSSSDAEYGGGIGVEEKRRSSSLSSMSFVEWSRVVNGWNNEKQLEDQGMWNSNMENNYSTPFLDYGLEEIKQLISSSNCTTNVLF
ncbi:hypothetical protein IC575_010134 [Cucumis melo]|uniref:Transcription factor RAX2 n=1 Tax=Cucumis melo TaxID=3656 RepID=A0A9I9CW63_CUCME